MTYVLMDLSEVANLKPLIFCFTRVVGAFDGSLKEHSYSDLKENGKKNVYKD